MDTYGHASFLVWLFVVLIKVIHCQNCQERDQCSCVYDSDSSVVDITSLGNNDLTPRFKDIPSIADGNLYSYNPCFPFNEGNCQQVAACQVSQSSQTDIGSAQNVQFQYDEAADQLFVQYNEGGTGIQQTTTVVLLCDPDACTPQLAATGQSSPGSYLLALTTVCACPNGCDSKGPVGGNCAPSSGGSGFGGGVIFLIVFFGLLVLYLVGGVIYMKFVRKAQGTDVIPNKSFWVAVPSSVKGGVLFVLRPVLKRTKYENI